MNTNQLRQKILDLAIRGKLVPQDPNDEPASVLLERIRIEKEQLIKEGKIKYNKKDSNVFRSDDKQHYGQLPKGWEWVTVETISSVIQYGLSNSAEINGNYKLLRITDIQDNHVNWNTVPFTTISREQAKNYILEVGDIVFARTGATVGKSYMISEMSDITVFASYLIRVKIIGAYPKFIKYFFECNLYWEQITDKSVGIGQPNVNGTKLKELFLPLPPLEEQKRIVIALDSVISTINEIDNHKKNLTDVAMLLKQKILSLAINGKLVPQDPEDEPASLLLERIRIERENLIKTGRIKREKSNPAIVKSDDNSYYTRLPKNWVKVQIGEIHDIIRGITFPAMAKQNLITNGTVACATTGSIQKEYNSHADVYISEEYVKNNNQWLLNNDIIMSTANSRELVGKACLWKGKKRKTFGGFLTVLRATKYILPVYSFYVLQHLWLNGIFIEVATQTTNIANINNNILSYIAIPLPPLAEQHRIVTAIDTAFEQLDCIVKALV
jgi:type I restriction enzyme S subunit